MSLRTELASIEGVEIQEFVQRADGVVVGAIRLEQDLPATYVKLHQQGWTIGRSADEVPGIANTLAIDSVPFDTLLIRQDSDEPIFDSIR